MFKLFEAFGQLSLQGADAVDSAMSGITDRAEAVAGGMDRAAKATGAAGSALTKGVTGPALAAATALGGLAFRAVSVGDDLAKFGRSVGLNVEALQEYEFALGRIAGVSEQQTRKALTFLNKTIAEGTQGMQPAIDALTQLGFSQEDIASGAIKTEQAMDAVFNAIRNAGSEAEAQAIAMDLFGSKAGIALANNIREGAETVEDARRIFREEVGGMSQEQAEAAEAASDAWAKFTKTLSNVTLVAGAELLPAFTSIVEMLDGSLGPAAKRAGEGFARMIEFFTEMDPTVRAVVFGVAAFVVALGPLLLIISRLLTVGAFLVRMFLGAKGLLVGLGVAFKIAAGAVAVLGGPLTAIVAVLALLGSWLFLNRGQVGEWAATIAEMIGKAWEAFKEFGNQIAQALREALTTVGRFATEAGKAFGDWVRSVVDMARELGRMVAGIIGDMVSSVVSRINDMVSRALSAMRRLYREAVGNSIIPDLARDVGRVVGSMADDAVAKTDAMADGMLDSMREAAPAFGQSPSVRAGGASGPGGSNYNLQHATFITESSIGRRLDLTSHDLIGGF